MDMQTCSFLHGTAIADLSVNVDQASGWLVVLHPLGSTPVATLAVELPGILSTMGPATCIGLAFTCSLPSC